jgi:uncharacterized protein (UPF0332 family)
VKSFWTKAKSAAKSAHTLLELGDSDGAVSRAYYAMFDAARSALEHIDPKLAEAKTHTTIIRRFSKHFVMNGPLSAEFGPYLGSTEDTRITADYERDGVSPDEAKRIVARMDEFMIAIEAVLSKSQP